MPISFTVAEGLAHGPEVIGVGVYDDLTWATDSGEPPPGLSSEYLAQRGFKASLGQALVVPDPSDPNRAVVALGLGKGQELSEDTLRRAGAELVRAAGQARSVAILVEGVVPDGSSPARVAQAVVEGAALAAHSFAAYKKEPRSCSVEEFRVVGSSEELASGVRRGEIVARAINLARDLVNEPAGVMTPRRLAEVAAGVAGVGNVTGASDGATGSLRVTVWDENDIAREGLGGLAGVAQGSDEPPRLIRFDYEPAPGGASDPDQPPLVLVGKGITFDSGGLSIKSAEGMMTMKYDMSGAAAVLATMSVLADLGTRSRVIGFTPVTENMSNGRATKPGDVLHTRNHKTIEVLNTDAEGRLVLADALALAAEQDPGAIVDLATLTGACVTALGKEIAGLMANDDAVADRVLGAGERAGEAIWRLPLARVYAKHIESEVADMKNMGAPGGAAGTITAALILSEFVGDAPWAHLDIAGPAWTEVEEGYCHKGATGYGVRTLVELVAGWDEAR
ncbi:MAG: leucyl aminopeptidase [Acidimicrobiales bacterium]